MARDIDKEISLNFPCPLGGNCNCDYNDKNRRLELLHLVHTGKVSLGDACVLGRREVAGNILQKGTLKDRLENWIVKGYIGAKPH